MGEKSKPRGQGKKPGRSLKEKRVAKRQKEDAKKQDHKGWDAR
jgi:hypothetical protein